MTDDKIIEQVLLHLDNWITTEDYNSKVGISGADYNKKVSKDEILNFYNVAYNYALSYAKLTEFPTTKEIIIVDDEEVEVIEILKPISTAIYMWCAGLLWNKYNIRSNNQIDETNTLGFGDKLVIQAKEMLKQYKDYSFYAY